MKVTVCQIDNRPENLEASWQALVDHVGSVGSEFVLLPEMPFSDWLAAEEQVDGARWQKAVHDHEHWLERLPELGAQAVAGTRPALDGHRRRNRAFVHCDGRVEDIRDKAYLPDEPWYWEASWYEPGPVDYPTFSAAGAVAGVQICTEMWFLQHARAYGEAGAQLLCVPRATPHQSIDKWLAGGRTAGVVAGAFCLSSALWNPPGAPANLGGLAWITDPEGNVLATTTPQTPAATADIDLADADAAKRSYPRYVTAPAS
ncbi:MAG: carbon-nitrogen hydrolase family protein [Rhodovibrionaceae bacterium]|nr:carbon-nitrogen hydrolase family protein [Rhodovibrionaceae bacterium]